jgi:hypothetical protein
LALHIALPAGATCEAQKVGAEADSTFT